MTPEDAKLLQDHIKGIAQILYKNTDAADLMSLEAIEKSVRSSMLKHISPQVAFFSSSKSLVRPKVERDN